ncbi:MAG: type II toxin-antitoxin system VapC family toxin [Candidatus Hydrothermarchaeaceae archaeon]
MRFLDANVFIYAYYRPHIRLDKEQRLMKEKSKDIVEQISEGKLGVITTVVHLSEISNILKRSMDPDELEALLLTLYSLNNVNIEGVSADDYLLAVDTAKELALDPNDALAIDVMQKNEIDEILSFDRGFDGVEGIKRLP